MDTLSFLGTGFTENAIATHEKNRCYHRVFVNSFFIVALFYYWSKTKFGFNEELLCLSVTLLYGSLNMLYLYSIVKNKFFKLSKFFQYFFLLLDGPSMVFGLLVRPEQLSFLSPFFLFLCIGVGLRYGLKIMIFNVVMVLLFFTGTVFISSYWQNNINLTIMVYLMLLGVPVYFSVLMKKIESANAELHNLAMYDHLTKLGNRRFLIQTIDNFKSRANRNKNQFSIFYFDLDNFKSVNDKLGHDSGDLLLIKVAHELQKSFRTNDFIARIGGDEFVALVDISSSNEDANIISQKILTCVHTAKNDVSPEINVSASIGVCIYDETKNLLSAEDLLKQADLAQYQAKHNGKSGYKILN